MPQACCRSRQPSSTANSASKTAGSAADIYGLPISTTHVLPSGVAGTTAASGSGLQLATIRNLLMAWVLTLPMAICISGGHFILFINRF
jgi:PiT family inorganic phosphate transporter